MVSAIFNLIPTELERNDVRFEKTPMARSLPISHTFKRKDLPSMEHIFVPSGDQSGFAFNNSLLSAVFRGMFGLTRIVNVVNEVTPRRGRLLNMNLSFFQTYRNVVQLPVACPSGPPNTLKYFTATENATNPAAASPIVTETSCQLGK